MPIRFAIVPVERVGSQRGPAFLRWRRRDEAGSFVEVTRWAMVDYGVIDRAIVAVDADTTALQALDAQPGIIALPANLDANPGGAARTQIRDALEAVNVPAQWVAAGLSWRQIARAVTGMFLFMQGLTVRTGSSPLDWQGVTWNTTFGALAIERQVALQEAASAQGWQGTIPNGATIRQILKSAADLWQGRPLYFGFAEL